MFFNYQGTSRNFPIHKTLSPLFLKNSDFILAKSSYFDSSKRLSYTMIVMEVKNINNLKGEIKNSVSLLCNSNKCLPNEKIEFIVEHHFHSASLVYFSIVNKENSKTYIYRLGPEVFFFDSENKVVGANGIFITDTLPICRSEYKVSSKFGYRIHPVYKTKKLHGGVDMAAKKGTKIFAAGDGIVLESKFRYDYGYYVKIKHENSVETIYAHMCSKPPVMPGDVVKKGDLVGYVGATGLATGPHLHFEIRKNGIRIDPEKFLFFPQKILTNKHNLRQKYVKIYFDNLHFKLESLLDKKQDYKIWQKEKKLMPIIPKKSEPIKKQTPMGSAVPNNISKKVYNKPLLKHKKVSILKNKPLKTKSN